MVAMKKIAFAAIAAAASADQVAANCCPSLCGSSSKPVNTTPSKPVSAKVNTKVNATVDTHTEDDEDKEDHTAANDDEDDHDEDNEDNTNTGAPSPSAVRAKVDSAKAFSAERLNNFCSSMEDQLGENGVKGAKYGTGAICCAGVSYALYASFGQAGMVMVKKFGSAFRKALPQDIQDKFFPQPVKELTKTEKVAHKLAQPVDVAQDFAGQGVAAAAAFAAKHADKTAEVAAFAAKQYNKLPETPAALKNHVNTATTVVGEKASQVWSQVPGTPEQVSSMVGKAMGALPAWEVAQVFVKAAVTVVTASFCLAKTAKHGPVLATQAGAAAMRKAGEAQALYDGMPNTQQNIQTAQQHIATAKKWAQDNYPQTCQKAAAAKTATATFVAEQWKKAPTTDETKAFVGAKVSELRQIATQKLRGSKTQQTGGEQTPKAADGQNGGDAEVAADGQNGNRE